MAFHLLPLLHFHLLLLLPPRSLLVCQGANREDRLNRGDEAFFHCSHVSILCICFFPSSDDLTLCCSFSLFRSASLAFLFDLFSCFAALGFYSVALIGGVPGFVSSAYPPTATAGPSGMGFLSAPPSAAASQSRPFTPVSSSSMYPPPPAFLPGTSFPPQPLPPSSAFVSTPASSGYPAPPVAAAPSVWPAFDVSEHERPLSTYTSVLFSQGAKVRKSHEKEP